MSRIPSATPEPEAGETVIWRHASSSDFDATFVRDFSKPTPAWLLKFMYPFHVLMFAIFLGLYLYENGSANVLSVEFWLDWLRSNKMILAAFVFGLGAIWWLEKFLLQAPATDKATGIPLWMSRRRIVFNPSRTAHTNELDIKAVQSISTDFIEGSAALVFRTSTDTFRLITSETRSLLQHLYTLRPDLEPTS